MKRNILRINEIGLMGQDRIVQLCAYNIQLEIKETNFTHSNNNRTTLYDYFHSLYRFNYLNN